MNYFNLRKHIITGLGSSADLFLKKKCEIYISPHTGIVVSWVLAGRKTVEVVKEVVVNLDTDEVDLWTDSDRVLDDSTLPQKEKLDRLAVMVKDYLNDGWTLSK